VNYWPESSCAKAFWGQQELPSYRRLLAHTVAWLEPRQGERWLDLGCGCGKLTEALWQKSGGTLLEVVGIDCAGANAKAFHKLCDMLRPTPPEGRIRFVEADFSSGLATWESGRFHGVVSGLAIQYADSYSPERGCWTTEAYDRLLSEVYRLLRPAGTFVFSVNVPEPSFARVALHGVLGVFRARRMTRYIRKSFQMWRYGSWLKREARRGRFHYLPLEKVMAKLNGVGFTAIEHRLSFSQQAYLLRCRKPS
jgi:ubiquinone/menaquinone biosynthesis C-methylase UbiE